VIEALLWGALGAAALLVGALAAYLFDPSRQVMAVVMALGTGLLIGSVSFELVDEALAHQAVVWVALLVLVGSATFTARDWLLTRNGGGERKDADGAQADGNPLAVVGGDPGLGPVRGRRLRAAGPAFRPHRGAGAGVRGRALLAMLADTLLPEAYKVEGVLTGSLVVAGFAVSLALSAA
jgi:zinc transporter, ZIP family